MKTKGTLVIDEKLFYPGDHRVLDEKVYLQDLKGNRIWSLETFLVCKNDILPPCAKQ